MPFDHQPPQNASDDKRLKKWTYRVGRLAASRDVRGDNPAARKAHCIAIATETADFLMGSKEYVLKSSRAERLDSIYCIAQYVAVHGGETQHKAPTITYSRPLEVVDIGYHEILSPV